MAGISLSRLSVEIATARVATATAWARRVLVMSHPHILRVSSIDRSEHPSNEVTPAKKIQNWLSASSLTPCSLSLIPLCFALLPYSLSAHWARARPISSNFHHLSQRNVSRGQFLSSRQNLQRL